MGLLSSSGSAFLKSANKTKEKNSINKLNRIALAREAFKHEFLSDSQFSPDDLLALNNPVQFIYKYLNQDVIDNAIKTNPEITRLVNDNKLSIKYNLNNVSSIVASHLLPCARMVHRIYFNINKQPLFDDYICLIQAALLHDIGKIFIPEKILFKAGKLSLKERQIIELHNRLSYEILKTTKLKLQVAQLAWEHHDYDNCFKRTPENQALMIADIYSALREARPYKRALNDIAAKTILYDMGANGKFDSGYINYLCY